MCVVAAMLGFAAVPKAKRAPVPPPVRCVPSEGDALTGIGPDAGIGGAPLPERPAPWQQPGPPCRRGERALKGACYVRYDREDMAPPCAGGTYEHEGRCYRAVARTKAEPTSFQR